MLLTDKQTRAIDEASRFNGDIYRIGATPVQVRQQSFGDSKNRNAKVCAFTGKAAFVLRQKGVKATTIHSLIYEWDEDNQLFFLKNEVGGDCFIVDEASMISRELYQDLCYFKKPIIAVGDPGQLEPVGDDINLMVDCDIVLDEIHRQAANSRIIAFATAIRTGEEYESFL